MSTRELAKEMCMSRGAIWEKVKKEGIEVKWHYGDKERPHSMWLINTEKFSEYLKKLSDELNP